MRSVPPRSRAERQARARRALVAAALASAIVFGLAACSSNSTSAGSAESDGAAHTGGSSTTSTNGSPAESATHLLAAALANANAQRSLHYVSVTASKQQTVTISGDVTTDSGWQTIVDRDGTKSYVSEVRLLHHECYIRGDVGSLRSFFGLTAGDSTRYAGRWISVVPSDSYYDSAAAALTVSSVIDEIELGKPVSGGPTVTVNRQLRSTLHGSLTGPAVAGAKGSANLTVTAGRMPLPVRWWATITSPGSFVDSTTLSRWGERVTVVAPRLSVPMAEITGTPTPTTGPPIAV